MKIFDLKRRIMDGENFVKDDLVNMFEEYRSQKPVIYNIETTNACNMKCVMCPRTTMMTRDIVTMDLDTFEKVADQISPWTESEWSKWQGFVEAEYGIQRNDMSENHFFLHIIPEVIVLHGYGDPLLDKQISSRIKILTKKNIKSYFSCNPANINIEKTTEMFECGLDLIKFSIESVDDFLHKQIRGNASNFSDSYEKILQLLEVKKKNNYKTTIVITMLDLKNENQQEQFERLKQAFRGSDVYIYFKSQDQQWYQDKDEGTNSIHWIEFCQFPWSSITVKSNGEVAMCVEDYNNEIILGDARKDTLYDIWNGNAYAQFRMDHFRSAPGLKCDKKCDMKLIGDYLNL